MKVGRHDNELQVSRRSFMIGIAASTLFASNVRADCAFPATTFQIMDTWVVGGVSIVNAELYSSDLRHQLMLDFFLHPTEAIETKLLPLYYLPAESASSLRALRQTLSSTARNVVVLAGIGSERENDLPTHYVGTPIKVVETSTISLSKTIEEAPSFEEAARKLISSVAPASYKPGLDAPLFVATDVSLPARKTNFNIRVVRQPTYFSSACD